MITDPVAAFAETIADLQREIEALQQKASRPSYTAWTALALASGAWAGTGYWRHNAGRVELRGSLVRTTSTFAAGATLFGLTGNAIPEPPVNAQVISGAAIAAQAPIGTSMLWVVDISTHVFRSSSTTHAPAVGDTVILDGIWWPTS